MLAFAVAIAFNLPAALQRVVPDYTSALQDRVGGSEQIAEKLNLGGLVNDQNKNFELHRRRSNTRKLWHRTGYQGHHGLVQHAG